MQLTKIFLLCIFLLSTLFACSTKKPTVKPKIQQTKKFTPPKKAIQRPTGNFANRLVSAAHARTRHRVVYNGAYRRIRYPWGDVPNNIGVCTDVIVRSYRKLGIDLQQQVHEDMKRNFHVYPSKRLWGLDAPDPNIDHRRVLNLEVFFTRRGSRLPVTRNPNHYRPGDLVTWKLPGLLPHIGIVSTQRSRDGKRPLITHNIGKGPVTNDILFRYKIIGHYRYHPRRQIARR